MDDDAFWATIERNRGDAKAVAAELGKWPAHEIAAWHRAYYDRHNALHRGEIWDVADILFNHLAMFPSSGDSFHYFKAWVIGRGRAAYETALRDPDALEPFIRPEDVQRYCDNESLSYAAEDAWEARGGNREELDRQSNEATEPVGDRVEPEDWGKRYPKLIARFGPFRGWPAP